MKSCRKGTDKSNDSTRSPNEPGAKSRKREKECGLRAKNECFKKLLLFFSEVLVERVVNNTSYLSTPFPELRPFVTRFDSPGSKQIK
jgi:hypothetical protein